MKYVLLISFPLLLSLGQILFKKAATVNGNENFLLSLMNMWMFAALVVYGGATMLWVWILKTTPLSTAYPFVALSFVVVPLAAMLVFHEPLGSKYFVGCGLLALGLIMISRA